MSKFKYAILIAFLAAFISTDALAKTMFLPNVSDDMGFSGKANIDQNHNQGNTCSAFPLNSCPANGICSRCSFGNMYKLNRCKSGFSKSGNSCVASSCSAVNSSYKATIPTNNICTKFTTGSLTCYKDCRAIGCAEYSLNCDAFTVANSASKDVCPDCNSADANCSPKLCKVGTCQEGYKLANNATQCLALDNNCPNGYYKTCETGTQGDPQYTEAGTACYQCKPPAPLNLKYVVNMSKTCPSGLTFNVKNTSSSRNVSCTSKNCYEYDSTGYPYNYDGGHSNETESIVNEGTIVTISNLDPKITSIKSIATKTDNPISGGTFSFTVNNRDVILTTVGTDGKTRAEGSNGTTFGLGAYDFWTLQCKASPLVCNVSNCQTCVSGSSSQCQTCKSGYTLNDGKCINKMHITLYASVTGYNASKYDMTERRFYDQAIGQERPFASAMFNAPNNSSVIDLHPGYWDLGSSYKSQTVCSTNNCMFQFDIPADATQLNISTFGNFNRCTKSGYGNGVALPTEDDSRGNNFYIIPPKHDATYTFTFTCD